MARAFVYDLQVADGLVQAWAMDTLSEDDLPRPSPSPAGGYTFATVTVDQWGRVTAAADGDTSDFALLSADNLFLGANTIQVPRGSVNLTLTHTPTGPGSANYLECYNPSATLVFYVRDSGVAHASQLELNSPLGVTYGGTAADLSATGPGLAYQAAVGDPLTVVTTITGGYTAVADAKTTVPFTTQGFASQTADLLQCKDSSNNVIFGFGGASGTQVITCYGPNGGTSGVAFSIDGNVRWNVYSTGPSGYNFFFDRSGVGALLAIEYASPYRFGIGANATTYAAALKVESNATTTMTLLARRKASQTASLQEWQDESSNPLVTLRASGTLAPAHLADAAAENDSIYYSTTASKLVYKDSGGTVNNLY